MTREQESDSTLSPGKGGGRSGNTFPAKIGRTAGISTSITWWVCITTSDNNKRSDVFLCGANTHDYRDCPTMHQYIREQADALAQRRMGEYQQPREWRDMRFQGKCHPTGDHSLEEGGPMKGDQSLVGGPLGKKHKNRKYPLSQEKPDQLTHVQWGAWLQGVGERLHHQVGEVSRR